MRNKKEGTIDVMNKGTGAPGGPKAQEARTRRAQGRLVCESKDLRGLLALTEPGNRNANDEYKYQKETGRRRPETTGTGTRNEWREYRREWTEWL